MGEVATSSGNAEGKNQYSGSAFTELPARKALAAVLLETGLTRDQIKERTGLATRTIDKIRSGESKVVPALVERARASELNRTEALMTPYLDHLHSEEGLAAMKAQPIQKTLEAVVKLAQLRSSIELMDTEQAALEEMPRADLVSQLSKDLKTLHAELGRDKKLAKEVELEQYETAEEAVWEPKRGETWEEMKERLDSQIEEG